MIMSRLVILLISLVSVSVMMQAQDYITTFSAQHQFDTQFERAAQRYSFENFKGSPKAWQKKFRAELAQLLGVAELQRIYKDFVPKAEQIDCEDLGYATRERWQIWTEPTMVIPFMIVRPKGELVNVPLCITSQGHDDNPELYAGIFRDEAERVYLFDGERDLALRAARNGFIAILPTTRGFGKTMHADDIRKKKENSCRYYQLRDQLVGRTLVGDRVWDVMKILDWALANLPVDKNRVIQTGNSGGGTVSIYAGALDERITFCAPSACVCCYHASIGAIGHCHCNYVPGIMNLCNMGDLAGLVAPRKLLIINGKLDDIFPIEGAREEFKTTKAVYEALGASQECEMYEGPEGHRYYPLGFYDFYNRHF